MSPKMIMLQQADPFCIPRHALSVPIELIALSALHFKRSPVGVDASFAAKCFFWDWRHRQYSPLEIIVTEASRFNFS